MERELTKGDVYVVIDTPKKAKKLKKLLDMFGERTYSNYSIQDCLDNNKNVIGFEKEDNAFMSSYVDQFDNFREKVSIKELRNILAKEHLREGDYVVCEDNFICRIDKIENCGIYFSNPFVGVYDISYFKRYATPEEIALLETKPKELEIGKWYKKVNKKGEVFIFNHQKNGKSYGWFKGRWVDNDWLTDCFFDYILLDTKEVESALIEDAKRRYRVGDKLIKLSCHEDNSIGNRLFNHKLSYQSSNNTLWIDDDKGYYSCIFHNGKWAKVIDKFAELKEAESKGKVLECKAIGFGDSRWILKTHKDFVDKLFEYRIKPEDPVKTGDWMFNPNTKKITQVKKDNHGKSLIGSGWVKIKDTELVEKLNSL